MSAFYPLPVTALTIGHVFTRLAHNGVEPHGISYSNLFVGVKAFLTLRERDEGMLAAEIIGGKDARDEYRDAHPDCGKGFRVGEWLIEHLQNDELEES